MTKSEIDDFLTTVESALNEVRDRPIPIDADGKKHFIQRTSHWHVPADLMDLLEAAGELPRLERTTHSHRHGIRRNPGGSADIFPDIRAARAHQGEFEGHSVRVRSNGS
jgi:hypothetical protein